MRVSASRYLSSLPSYQRMMLAAHSGSIRTSLSSVTTLPSESLYSRSAISISVSCRRVPPRAQMVDRHRVPMAARRPAVEEAAGGINPLGPATRPAPHHASLEARVSLRHLAIHRCLYDPFSHVPLS